MSVPLHYRVRKITAGGTGALWQASTVPPMDPHDTEAGAERSAEEHRAAVVRDSPELDAAQSEIERLTAENDAIRRRIAEDDERGREAVEAALSLTPGQVLAVYEELGKVPCAYCREVVKFPSATHWRICAQHPARAELERLTAERDAAQAEVAGLTARCDMLEAARSRMADSVEHAAVRMIHASGTAIESLAVVQESSAARIAERDAALAEAARLAGVLEDLYESAMYDSSSLARTVTLAVDAALPLIENEIDVPSESEGT